MDLDLPELPPGLLADATDALCRGGRDCTDPSGHRRDALVVLDATRAQLHAATLRWAADRIRHECYVHVGDACCECCAQCADDIDAWADAASPPDGPERPADEPATPTRTTGTPRARNLIRRRQEARP